MTPGDYEAYHLPLVAAVIAGFIAIGLMIDWFRRVPIKTRPKRTVVTTTRPSMSIARSMALEKRLQHLHVIDTTWSTVKIVPMNEQGDGCTAREAQ